VIQKLIDLEGLKWAPRKKKAVYISSNRDADLVQLHHKYTVLNPEPKITFEVFAEQLEKHLTPAGSEGGDFDPMFETCFTVEEMIEQAMELQGVTFSAKGDEVLNAVTGDSIKLDDFQNAVLFHRDKYSRDSTGGDGKPFRAIYLVEETKRALDYVITQRAKIYLQKVRDRLHFKGPGFAKYADQVLNGLFKNCLVPDNELEITVIMFKQWIWQVKAFLYNQEVPDPIFINIQSAIQGGGKTAFVNRMAEPIKDYMDPDAKLLHALDERERNRFTSNYVVFFDELVIGNSSNDYGQAIAAFKQILTSKMVNPRTMYTTKQSKMKRVYSGIGTSNPPMIETIYDDTGMRRFFEIHFNIKQGSIYEELQKIDPLALWQGIDENLPAGFIPADSREFLMLREVQAGYKRADLIDVTLEHGDLLNPPLHVDTEKYKRLLDIMGKVKGEIPIKELESQAGVQLILVHQFRRDVLDWVKDNVEYAATKFVKGVNTFPSAMTEKGYGVIKRGNSFRIVCDGETLNVPGAHAPGPAYKQPPR